MEKCPQRFRTILNLPDTGFDVVKGQVADLLLQTVQIHIASEDFAKAMQNLSAIVLFCMGLSFSLGETGVVDP